MDRVVAGGYRAPATARGSGKSPLSPCPTALFSVPPAAAWLLISGASRKLQGLRRQARRPGCFFAAEAASLTAASRSATRPAYHLQKQVPRPPTEIVLPVQAGIHGWHGSRLSRGFRRDDTEGGRAPDCCR